MVLKSFLSSLSGTDSNCLFNISDENLSVTHMICGTDFSDLHDDRLHILILHNNLYPDFRKKIDGCLKAFNFIDSGFRRGSLLGSASHYR